VLLAAALACALSCGDDGGGGMAGAPPAPLGLGDVCRGGLKCEAAAGLVCSYDSFAGQCSTQCNTTASCQLIDPRGVCFEGTPRECGLPCTGTTTCPAGTACASVPGGMACKAQ
jgi:hypothetical protein